MVPAENKLVRMCVPSKQKIGRLTTREISITSGLANDAIWGGAILPLPLLLPLECLFLASGIEYSVPNRELPELDLVMTDGAPVLFDILLLSWIGTCACTICIWPADRSSMGCMGSNCLRGLGSVERGASGTG